MKRLLPLALVMLVLVTSGCVDIPGLGGGAGATGNGVEITDFQSDLDSVYSGESVNFQLKIQNGGSFDSDGDAYLYLDEWNCQPGRKVPVHFDSLLAPDEERGTAGEEFVAMWKCTAPTIDKGLKVPYEARAEVWYDYKTISSKSVTLLPTADLIALRDSGQPLPSELISKSDSPLDVDVQIEGPLRVMRDTDSIEFPVNIIITNGGGGVIEESSVELNLEALGGITIKSTDCDGTQKLAMWRGKSQTVTCEMSATNVDVITQARIVATLSYGYTVSAQKSITVEGTRAAFGY